MVLTIRPTKAAGFGVVGNTFCGGIGHSTKSGRIRESSLRLRRAMARAADVGPR